MTLLVLGVALWWAAHLVKGVAPGLRADLDARLGPAAARGAFAVALLVSVVLMVIGFRRAEYVGLWASPDWTVHLNNLLMVIAVLAFATAHSKSRARAWLRHPMLLGLVLWAVAHLLVNGDLASLVLFGGLGVWSLVEMAVINRRDGPWIPPATGTRAGDVRLVVISAIVFVVIVAVHTWLGYPPFR
ncbi:NnrU family protein [Amaricoccus sp.]|uniref:NnrU family protein n=1 Tax=Amaricoccus sp. TaxID=1872485 RepID=UPI001B559A17|nr:NnrU family protein [Amaricoccus sp.]MBP7001214.1 NnrU family protein [Amaricoccus sp.]